MTSARRFTLLMGSLLVCLAEGSPAAAQGHDPAAAEVLFDKGRAAATRQDWREACPAFEQSQALDPATGTLLNLAECRYQLGALATAWQDFLEAIRELPPKDPRRPFAERRVAELEKRLPHLTVSLAGQAPPGTVVTRNGVQMPPATLGLEIPIDPGTVNVVVTSPGRSPRSYSLAVAEGQSQALDVAPGDAEATPPADPTRGHAASHDAAVRVDDSPSGARSFGFVLTGVGIAGLAAGGVLGGFAFDRFSKYKSVCGPSLACQTQPQLTAANGLASDVNTFETATTISLAAGGALLVTGVVLVLTHPTKRSVAAFRTLEHLGGAAGPREGTVVWRGSF